MSRLSVLNNPMSFQHSNNRIASDFLTDKVRIVGAITNNATYSFVCLNDFVQGVIGGRTAVQSLNTMQAVRDELAIMARIMDEPVAVDVLESQALLDAMQLPRSTIQGFDLPVRQ